MDRQGSTSHSQKPPKPRNSELRKEQNRIASRAYREKRKQKLALLDEILRTESRDSSSPSLADDSDDCTPNLSPPSTRHSSHSPVPVASSMIALSPPSDHTVQPWQYPAYEQGCRQESNWYSADGVSNSAEDYSCTGTDMRDHTYAVASHQYYATADLDASSTGCSSGAGYTGQDGQHLMGEVYNHPSLTCHANFSCGARTSFHEQDPSLPSAYDDVSRLDHVQQQEMAAALHHHGVGSRSMRGKKDTHCDYDDYYHSITSPVPHWP